MRAKSPAKGNSVPHSRRAPGGRDCTASRRARSSSKCDPAATAPPSWKGEAKKRRTPTGTQRDCNASFKSPVPSPRASQPDAVDKETLQHEIEELKRKELGLDQEIAQLWAEGCSVEELDTHIALLHEYNEMKDTGQMLLGKLAVIRGVTTKELYPEFGLELSD